MQGKKKRKKGGGGEREVWSRVTKMYDMKSWEVEIKEGDRYK